MSEEYICELCRRKGFYKLTEHHLIPRENGGRHKDTAWLCEDCHKQIHALYTNKELAVRLNTLSKLEEEEKIDYLDEQIDNILNVEENDDERDFNLDILSNNDVNVTLNEPEKVTDVVPLKEDDKVIQEQTQVKEEVKEEYITYHVHVVSSNDSVESIMKMYNANLDTLKEYNDIKELKVGDKVIIPFIADE